MERSVYERMNALEAEHWWFTGRRKVLAALIGRLINHHANASILEAGCGSGGNLAMLQGFGEVDAFEYDDVALQVASEKTGLNVLFGALPYQIPFADKKYDLVGLFDVLEHVEADEASLSALAARLSESGRILVSVPAFPFLWSKHDERHHHFRRYTRASLTAVAERAGLKVTYSSYFNTFLFPAAVAARALKKLLGRETPDDQMPSSWVNKTLAHVFSFEQHMLGRVSLPFGLSLVAVLRKA
jgi:SAM-dependent methyltransferase